MKFEEKIIWPNGKKFAVCLTHDVDKVKKTHQYLTRSVRFLKKRQIKKSFDEMMRFIRTVSKNIKDNPYWTFEQIMELEKSLDVKSTFFFLNETGKIKILKPHTWKLYSGRYNIDTPEIMDIIKKLDLQGWEIGLHGSYNSYRDMELLKKEKDKLESIISKKIIGIRQHYLNLNIPITWEFQEAIGLRYDSSFGSSKDIGYRDDINMPYYPLNSTFLEIPMNIMDAALFKENISQEDAIDRCIKYIELAEKNNGLITLLWHTDRFNETEFPGQAGVYKEIIRECIEKDAWVTNACEIHEWIIAKEIN
ncbi:polysaccharide deacetylase family protein [Methanosarcina mazei]|uniref:NodB homology domain-containing protein n=1 Tax=Methanosarcina mazei SarPi TaxID=1434115 RepID=A0A0E3LSV7_METMZ|nr:polysaccharide deacetylase family protein [Methanosarcina mazei]AKB62441.1 hypothetical protein MSMAP_2456 [Methanosarcina mazei SarPi]